MRYSRIYYTHLYNALAKSLAAKEHRPAADICNINLLCKSHLMGRLHEPDSRYAVIKDMGTLEGDLS